MEIRKNVTSQKSDLLQVSGDDSFASTLFRAISIMVPLNVFLWWISSYFDEHFPAAISFLAEDGHCEPSTQGIGTHCFGDFIAPMKEAHQGVSFIANSAPANFLYEIGTAFVDVTGPTRIALAVYLIVSILSLAAPAWWVYKKTQIRLPYIFLLCGPLTYPALAVLDRGNNIAFAIPFLTSFCFNYVEGKHRKSTFALIAASTFKPHLLALFIVYLSDRKFSEFCRGLISGLVFHLVFILRYEPNVILGIKKYIQQLSTYSSYVPLDHPTVSNVSIAKGVHSLAKIFPKSIEDPIVGFVSLYSTWVGLAFLVAVCLGLWLRKSHLSKTDQIIMVLPIVVLVPGVTFAPYLSCVLVVIAIKLAEGNKTLPARRNNSLISYFQEKNTALLIAVVCTMFPVIIPGTSGDGKQLSSMSIIPLSWMLSSLIYCTVTIRPRSAIQR